MPTTTLTTIPQESRQITLQERCERLDLCNPAAISKTFAAVKSTADCLALRDAGEPVLKAIARQGDRVKLAAVLALNIAALDKFLHLKNPLSGEECDFIAEQIIDEFGGSLTFADIHLVMRNIKAGKYGKLYERLSAPDILTWFRQYYNNRLDAAEAYSREKDKRELHTHGDEALLLLGYSIDMDGKIMIDRDKVAQDTERRTAEKKEEEERQKRIIDADNSIYISLPDDQRNKTTVNHEVEQ